MTANIFPWQIQQWQQLIASKQQNRLPHALLLTGVRGLGKKLFALAFARALLCQVNGDEPCGQCHSCHLLSSQAHPDLLMVEPDGQMIKIDQIREMVQFVNETAFQNGLRIIIINPANAMNMNAANALLKTLEEPAPNSLMILISDQGLRLPATILSRCQKIIFNKPAPDVAQAWLQTQNNSQDPQLLLNLAAGAPLRAKELAENGLFTLRQELYQGLDLLAQSKADPLQLAIQCQEQDLTVLLSFMFVWLQDLLRIKLTYGEAELINFDYQPVFVRLAQRFSHAKLLQYLDHVKKIYAHALSSVNLNRQLVLEELFIYWTQYATC
ncbi:MAG: DNA polymerase III subunit delta' [Gammaproteobacteria bacterium]